MVDSSVQNSQRVRCTRYICSPSSRLHLSQCCGSIFLRRASARAYRKGTAFVTRTRAFVHTRNHLGALSQPGCSILSSSNAKRCKHGRTAKLTCGTRSDAGAQCGVRCSGCSTAIYRLSSCMIQVRSAPVSGSSSITSEVPSNRTHARSNFKTFCNTDNEFSTMTFVASA